MAGKPKFTVTPSGVSQQVRNFAIILKVLKDGEIHTHINKELVVGPSISQLETRRRPIAEPWARKECVEWETGQFPSPTSRARSLPMRRRG